jgi:hypothetical protein
MADKNLDPDASPYAGLAARIRGGKSASAAEYDDQPPVVTVYYRAKAGLKRLGAFQIASAAAEALLSVQFHVELDGKNVGKLLPGQKLEWETTAGEHELRVVGLTASSSTRRLQLTNGQRLNFWCQASFSGIIFERQH